MHVIACIPSEGDVGDGEGVGRTVVAEEGQALALVFPLPLGRRRPSLLLPPPLPPLVQVGGQPVPVQEVQGILLSSSSPASAPLMSSRVEGRGSPGVERGVRRPCPDTQRPSSLRYCWNFSGRWRAAKKA